MYKRAGRRGGMDCQHELAVNWFCYRFWIITRPSYHLGEISGVIGFESNAMLLKELAELEQKQSEIALDYSNNLLQHISERILAEHGIYKPHIFRKRVIFWSKASRSCSLMISQ